MKTLVSTALIGLALVAATAPLALAEDENNVTSGWASADDVNRGWAEGGA